MDGYVEFTCEELRGRLVRLTRAFKRVLRQNGCDAHVREFGPCVGVVVAQRVWSRRFGGCVEVDVRWLPSGLRYAYDTESLARSRKRIHARERVKIQGWEKRYGRQT